MPHSSLQMSTSTSKTATEEAEYLSKPTGPDDNEISRQAQQRLPLSLSWGRKHIRLGTTFHSKLQSTDNPWSDETPFVLSDLHIIPKELHAEYGTTSTFKKVRTARQCETGDHLSLGFGIGVGLPFVASASVKGTFDQHIQENKDAEKISLSSSCRAGTIEFQRQPRLTKEAIIELKYGRGYEGLCEKYGDYYLAGYRLGGDTGILMSASGHRREQIDKWGIKATVTVLFVSASKQWEKEFRTLTAGRQIQLLGYDTLDDMTWKRSSTPIGNLNDLKVWAQNDDLLRKDADDIMTRSENLLERISEVLERHGYCNGESLTFSQCEELLAEGIVIELLLEPMSRLRDVMRWRNESNII